MLAVGALLQPAESHATGFFINQQSVAGLGRADAGNVAAANDLGTLFFNPAGLGALWENGDAANKADIAVHLIVPQSDLTDAGSLAATPGTLGTAVPFAGTNANDPSDVTPVLNAYFARRINERLSVGVRLNSPFGLAAEYDQSWFGRYDALEAELLTANLGGVAAWAVNDRLALSGGVSVQYADSTLASAIPNPLVPGGPTSATDGRFVAEGDSWEAGIDLGVLVRVGTAGRFGAHYRSAVDHDIEGSATTSGLTGPLAPFNGTVGAATRLDLPAILSLGFAYELGTRVVLFADYTWYGWGDLDTLRIDFANGAPAVVRQPGFRDTYSFAVGADFQTTDRLALRGGVKHDRSPTVDGFRDTTFADDDRLWLAFGGSYAVSSRWTVDFAYTHVLVDDTAVDVVRTFFDGTPLASSVRTRAAVDSTVDTLAASFRWSF
jgi:long-chain fatty acid transport protein